MKDRLLLLLVAFVWGTTFVFQRISTDSMGTFAFIGCRFLIGALAILPAVFWHKKKLERDASLREGYEKAAAESRPLPLWLCSAIIGAMLFGGSALQQQGLIYTTAGKGGFLTSLYIVAVPFAGLFLKKGLTIFHVAGCATALCGMYLLAFKEGGALNRGDLLVLIGVAFWTAQILCIDHFVKWYPGIYLAEGEFIATSLLGFLFMFFAKESLTLAAVRETMVPILYAGIMSSGVGYTLQIIAQAGVPPTEASLLMSCEMIFSAVSGFLFLDEVMTAREIFGAVLMTIGIAAAQIPGQVLIAGKDAS